MTRRVIVTPSQQAGLSLFLVHTAITCVYIECTAPTDLNIDAIVDRVVEAHRNSRVHIRDPFVCMLVSPTDAALALHVVRRNIYANLKSRHVPAEFAKERVLTATVNTVACARLFIADGQRALADYKVLSGNAAAHLQQHRWRRVFRADDSWTFTPHDAATNMKEARGEGVASWFQYVPSWLLQVMV